jgi:hypothetical protein
MPSVFVKPSSYGFKYVAGKNMDMSIDYPGKASGDRVIFPIINRWEIGSQHSITLINRKQNGIGFYIFDLSCNM